MAQVNLSTIRSDLGISGPISFGQIRNLSNKASGATISLAKVRDNAEYKGITSYNTGTVTEIINGTGNTSDGTYWLAFNGTKRRTVCLLNPKWFGGGWIGLEPNSFPISANVTSSATWVDNTTSLFGFSSSVMPKILQVTVVEGDCGQSSYYSIAGTNANGVVNSNAERMMLMYRVDTVGQCSRISNGTSMAYIDNPSTFSGETDYITYSGVCRWDDYIWAAGWGGGGSSYIPPESGLKRNWIFRSRTNTNTSSNFYWDNMCGSYTTGTHYHMWFFRDNRTSSVPTFALTNGRTLLDPGLKESYATTSSTVMYNLTPINIVEGGYINGSFTFNNTNGGIIRLNNTSGDPNANNARLNIGTRTIQSVSIWYYVHGRATTRYILDARDGLADGWVYNGGVGPGWSGSVMYINNSTSSVGFTFENVDIEGQWRCITIVRPTSFVSTLRIFSRYSENEGYNVSFGPIYISSEATSGIDHMMFYNQYSPRFNSVLLSGFTYHIYSGYYDDDPNWFTSRSEVYGIGLVTNMSSIVTSTNSVVPAADVWDQYSIEWVGYFYAPTTGTYTFYTISDDASYLWIGSTALSGYTTANSLVNNAGLHGMQERSGSISLTAGTYNPIRVQFGENYGGDNCAVSFAGPGIGRTNDFNGYAFSSTGLHSAYPAESARAIKTLTGTNIDGSYYINVNGISTLTYCLMDSKWDGGGWMMLMKTSNGSFSSSNTLSYPSSFTNSDILVGTISKPSNFVAGTITLTLRAYGGKTNANTMEGGAYINDVNGTRLVTSYIGDRANNSSSFDITDTVTVSLTDVQFPLTVRSWVWYGGWYINGITTDITMTGTSSSNGNTFNYDSTYWTDTSTTLNTNDTNRNTGDAKFNTMNYTMIKDVMALWPDSGYTGGSIALADTWSWLVNNFFGGGTRTTPLTGFSTANSRDSPTAPDPLNFTGFSSSIFSTQATRRHVIGGVTHVGGNLAVRWGFIWNNEGDFYTSDALGGIGMGTINYSAGDYYGCCGNSIGLNRRMRVEMYGR